LNFTGNINITISDDADEFTGTNIGYFEDELYDILNNCEWTVSSILTWVTSF